MLSLLGMLASESLAETIIDDLQQQPGWALALALVGIAALTVLIVRIVRMAGESWLVTDSDGIRCSPHKHHGPRKWLRHDWQLSWRDIERAVVERPGPKAQHIQNWINVTLSLESRQGQHDLALLLWEPVDAPLDRPDLMTFRPGKRLHELTETHPLIRHLEQRSIPVEYRAIGLRGRWGLGKPAEDRPDVDGADVPVDLLTHKALVVMLSLMGVIGVAAALHFTLLPPIRPLWSPNFGMLVLAAAVVFVAAAILSGSAPVRERTAVALMLGAMVGSFGYPLSVRMQSMTADAPVTADYIVEEAGRFEPVDERHPALDLTDLDIPEYWNSLALGELHPFDLQRVDEDRYILRLAPLFDRTRAFYSDSG